MAHRGASRVERENTVPAFRRAAQLGADAVELDVRRTSDGVLVVHHDVRVARLALPISETVYAELPDYVPTLGEALDACVGMWVNVEIKNDPDDPDFDESESIADETIANLVARGEDDRWLISCFRIETVDRCHAIAPAIRTAWLCSDVPDGVEDLLLGKGHAALHPSVKHLTRSTVAACHAAGLQVNTWTCDDPARIAQLIEWGTDGVCTNVPDVARTIIDQSLRSGEPV
ncbi:MAG: glycerophosphodiester phosphodiesterase [Actinobacteria bacterium]|nr:glycerophosphodiester phosphodiesterase [Actinomycetota bacterium]